MLCEDIALETGTSRAEALRRAVETEIRRPDGLPVTVSIGVANSYGDGTTLNALLSAADARLYAAKDAGRGVYRFYADAMHNQASERKAIEDALRDALAKDELRLVYQPIVDVASEQISGFEALIRWQRGS